MTQKSGNFTIAALLGNSNESKKTEDSDPTLRSSPARKFLSPSKSPVTLSELPCRLQLPVPVNPQFTHFYNKAAGPLNLSRAAQIQTLDPLRSFFPSNPEPSFGGQCGFSFHGQSRISPWWMYRLGHYMHQRIQGKK